jgi:coenzyme F420-reducing hydrogenase delta subunit
MAIGPLGGTARQQLADVRAFLAAEQPGASDVVIVGCSFGAARAEAERCGATLFTVPCVGAMHTSTVELLLRGGAGGVLVVACPEHDGRTREGVTWTEQRLYEGRKSELQSRVDARRVRLVQANIGENARLHDAALSFAAEIEELSRLSEEERVDLIALCRTGVLPDPKKDAV